MGEAARRKGLVEEARKKIGEEAASVVAALESRVNQLQLQHRAFVFEIETLRKGCTIATAAPAELRRDVRTFQGDLSMKAEQLEALAMRLEAAENRLLPLPRLLEEWGRFAHWQDVYTADEQLRKELLSMGASVDSQEEQLGALRANAAVDHRRVRRLEELTLWQRLRWLLTGALPVMKAVA